jgi:hypothetical protein
MKKSEDRVAPKDLFDPAVDEEGFMIKKPKTPTNKGGSAAERSRSAGRDRMTAKRRALKAVMNKIPASPTR